MTSGLYISSNDTARKRQGLALSEGFVAKNAIVLDSNAFSEIRFCAASVNREAEDSSNLSLQLFALNIFITLENKPRLSETPLDTAGDTALVEAGAAVDEGLSNK